MPNIDHEDNHVDLAKQLTADNEYLRGPYSRPLIPLPPVGYVLENGRPKAIGQARLKDLKALATALGLSCAGNKAAILARVQRAGSHSPDDEDWILLPTEQLDDFLSEVIVEPNGPANIIDTSTVTFEEGIAELTGDGVVLDTAPTMVNLDGRGRRALRPQSQSNRHKWRGRTASRTPKNKQGGLSCCACPSRGVLSCAPREIHTSSTSGIFGSARILQ
eukprot:COSAG05_NODE_7218_length_841_cov_1.892183_1_plen_218_part_01